MRTRPKAPAADRNRPVGERPGSEIVFVHLETLSNCLKRNLATPLTSATTVFVVAIALVLPALFSLLADNLSNLNADFQDSASLTLFLTDVVSIEEARQLSDDLLSRESVNFVEYTSQSQALAEFQARSGLGAIVAELGENPLPASLSVALASSDPDRVRLFAAELQALPQVEAVTVDLLWIQRLSAMQSLIRQLGLLLSIVLGLAVLLIVGNVIRSGIEQRRQEIDVIRLVGGTSSYIARPFLYNGLVLGFAGALLACLLIMVMQLAIKGYLDNLLSLYNSEFQIRAFTLPDALAMLVLGSLLGWSGAAVFTFARLRATPP